MNGEIAPKSAAMVASRVLGGSEADVRELIENQLRRNQWDTQAQVCREIPRHDDERRALGRLRPDFVLYPTDAARPIAVIEAKKSRQAAGGSDCSGGDLRPQIEVPDCHRV